MAESRTDKIICYGDSQTAGFSWGNRLPALLSSVDEAVGRGVSGQEAGSVAIRQGGIILTTTADCTISASTSPVVVPVQASVTPCNIRSSSSAMPMVLAGVRGELKILGPADDAGITAWSNANGAGTAQFTPASAPTKPVDVPSGQEIISQDVLDHPEWAGYVQVIWVGGNDSAFAGSTRVTGVVSAAQAMVDYMKTAVDTPLFLVASRTTYASEVEGTTAHATAVAQRDALAEAFPDQAIDIWGHVRDNGLSILGIEPTEADLAAIAGKSMPPSLTADNIHYNTQTREQVLAPFIASELAARGWATETEGEVTPVAEYKKTTWANDSAPDLDADNLNNLETGVSSAIEAAAAAAQGVVDVRDAVAGKADKVTGNNVVWTNNGSGAQASIAFAATSAASNTIPVRSSGGAIMAGEPSNAQHLTTKKYVDDGLAKKADTGAIPDVSGKADKSEIPDMSKYAPRTDFDALAARVTALETPAAPEE